MSTEYSSIVFYIYTCTFNDFQSFWVTKVFECSWSETDANKSYISQHIISVIKIVLDRFEGNLTTDIAIIKNLQYISTSIKKVRNFLDASKSVQQKDVNSWLL